MNATQLVFYHAPVKGSDLLALLVLAHRYDLGDHSYMTVDEIAKNIRLTVSATRKIMAGLKIDRCVTTASNKIMRCGPWKLNLKTLLTIKKGAV